MTYDPIDDLRSLPAWIDDALCGQTDPELFFPEKGGSNHNAKELCARCPVAAECLDYALDYESGERDIASVAPYGIYGGLSPRERRDLKKSLEQESA